MTDQRVPDESGDEDDAVDGDEDDLVGVDHDPALVDLVIVRGEAEVVHAPGKRILEVFGIIMVFIFENCCQTEWSRQVERCTMIERHCSMERFPRIPAGNKLPVLRQCQQH